jgi:hypothetical protein
MSPNTKPYTNLNTKLEINITKGNFYTYNSLREIIKYYNKLNINVNIDLNCLKLGKISSSQLYSNNYAIFGCYPNCEIDLYDILHSGSLIMTCGDDGTKNKMHTKVHSPKKKWKKCQKKAV